MKGILFVVLVLILTKKLGSWQRIRSVPTRALAKSAQTGYCLDCYPDNPENANNEDYLTLGRKDAKEGVWKNFRTGLSGRKTGLTQ